jgi:hypothetical protein
MPVPVVTQPTTPRVIAQGVAIPTLSISATNTPTSYAATPLPAGLSINTGTGAITGTPTAAGITTTSITATNGSGTSTAVSLVWDVQASPDGMGTWSDTELDLDLLTREVTRPLVATGDDGAVLTLLRKDEISLLVGAKKHGVLQDLKPGTQVVSVKLALKEFEPERVLTLAGGTPTKVGSGSTTRFRIPLEITEADWTVLSDYERDFRTEVIAYGEIEIEVGSYRVTSQPIRIRVVRDHFPPYAVPSPSPTPSASPSPSPSGSGGGLYEYTMSESVSPEGACILIPSTAFWGTTPTPTTGTYVYIDPDAVTPVGVGYISDGTDWYQVTSLGEIIATGSCTASPSPSPSPSPTPSASPSPSPSPSGSGPAVYSFELAYSGVSGAEACTYHPTVSMSTYYSTIASTTSWSVGNVIYSDSGATTPASDGNYSDGAKWWQMSSGVISATGSC